MLRLITKPAPASGGGTTGDDAENRPLMTECRVSEIGPLKLILVVLSIPLQPGT